MLLSMACILRLAGERSVGHIEQNLERTGHRLLVTGHVAEAFQILARESVDVVVADDCLPGLTGAEFLALLHQEKHRVPLIVVSGVADATTSPDGEPVTDITQECLASAAAAGDSTARGYRTMVVRANQVESAVSHMVELARLDHENEAFRRELAAHRSARQFLASSSEMEQILRTASTVAMSETPVLLEGETGTGKKLLAAVIHDLSDRRERPFLQLACNALPEPLIESALFGHERGVFTGAAKREVGAFERADGGTLLLEDVGALRPELQAKLLRAIETQSFQRVGGVESVPTSVRLVATTDRDLAADVGAGTFHAGLYERLSRATIRIPPLRQHPADIPALALHFARRAAQQGGREITGFAPETLAFLQSHAWPGNVRELRNAIERAMIASREPVLQVQWFQTLHESAPGVHTAIAAAHGDLVPRPSTESGMSRGPAGVVLETLSIDDAERALIRRALEVTGQNRTRAAALLGISVRTLRNKLNRPAGQQSTTSST